eukprot:TRINITY_DN614_c1_g1_i1.p1 TRINITY_DN614_c1_g1~~TRINITY_DN614_c1_g1_i1.p1  ORF type:complete len:730 (+),score=182.08 TRINITY_DN614_c1_g1_i1:64-2253(+)
MRVFAFAAGLAASAAEPTCVPSLNYPGGDLPNMPVAAADAAACEALCDRDDSCNLFTYHRSGGCSYLGETCPLPGGCCYMKERVVTAHAPVMNACTCSAWARVPKSPYVPPSPPKRHGRNVLYLVVDDLRPELEAYAPSPPDRVLHSPHINALAKRGTVFDNAYCQIAICGPSRLSFMTSRRPDNAGAYNFIDHFRQADCGRNVPNVRWDAREGDLLAHETWDGTACKWASTSPCGASGQCCTLCSERTGCDRWTFYPEGREGHCLLYRDGNATVPGVVADPEAVSGVGGGVFNTHAAWTSFPQWFKQHGYLTLSSGKIFHTEEGGALSASPSLNGPGMPPNQDGAASWSGGLSMTDVNAVANMWGCEMGENSTCPVDADRQGNLKDPKTTKPLGDRVIADDAVAKLRLAAGHLRATGTPFFMAVGFRKPHLPFRFPKGFLEEFPALAEVDVAAHGVLDPSQPAWAHFDSGPQGNPFTPIKSKRTAQQWRLFYRAAVAWMDSQLGRVTGELAAQGLEDTTLVALHADHGWSLGEHGEWEKFTNFEHGTRVPLIVSAPWLPESIGARTSVLAELIDVFPTVADAVGIPADTLDLDGVSLLPALASPANASGLKPYAVSQYPRCPVDPAVPWRQNQCTFIDRSQFEVMGYTIRSAEWRYTEWVRWNGTTLLPNYTVPPVARELYPHAGDDGRDFNAYENENHVKAFPDVAAALQKTLRAFVNSQPRWYNGL